MQAMPRPCQHVLWNGTEMVWPSLANKQYSWKPNSTSGSSSSGKQQQQQQQAAAATAARETTEALRATLPFQ